jgi:hypothetical protein
MFDLVSTVLPTLLLVKRRAKVSPAANSGAVFFLPESRMVIFMKNQGTPTVSRVLASQEMIEMLHDPGEERTSFACFDGITWRLTAQHDLPSGERLVPYSPQNNLLAHKVVLLPSEPEEYGLEADLLCEIQSFIHRYVDVSPQFEEIAACYVLFTWVYDAFGELPYLRVRGDYGSGKSRFLLTVGSIVYKPMFASGASSTAPLFRIMDAFQGTLVIDESDFRDSDERAEIVKILNNGNARGFPVLRCELNARKEFDPRAYAVFGPKIIATRRAFQDQALESRCLTEEMGSRPLRKGIPINLPACFEEEALQLRNKLLLFRFQNRLKERQLESLLPDDIEPRLRQIFGPVLSVIGDSGIRERLRVFAGRYQRELVSERRTQVEAQLLEVLLSLSAAGEQLVVKDITAEFLSRYGEEYGGKLTPRWIGNVLRRRLGLRTHKSHGTFLVPPSELPKLAHLAERYGVAAAGDQGTVKGRPGGHGDIGDDERGEVPQ